MADGFLLRCESDDCQGQAAGEQHDAEGQRGAAEGFDVLHARRRDLGIVRVDVIV